MYKMYRRLPHKPALLINILFANKKEMLEILEPYILGQIKKISVIWITGLKILGRVGTHTFF